MNRMVKGYLYIILSAVIFGFTPLVAKIAYANGMNSISLVFFRNLLAVPLLFMITRYRKESPSVSAKDLKQICILSLFCSCLTPLLLFSSYNYIAGGTATTFHFIYPAMTIIGGIVLFRKKANLGQILCVALCTFGITLFYTPGEELNLFGSALALLSGVTYAMYILLLDHLSISPMSRFKLSMYVCGLCTPVLLAAALLTDSFVIPGNLICWTICLMMAILVGCCAGVLFQMGTQLIGGERASILSTFEPITSIVVGLIFYNESLTLRSIFGTVCVLIATMLIALLDAKHSSADKM
ncbi:MAG: DMT family transporter [Oscillibacter sp.]|nr:DMT family transporter [Oscillibacter sp.]MBQ2997103.1 DMT family transporter [Oscillibacter sp.]